MGVKLLDLEDQDKVAATLLIPPEESQNHSRRRNAPAVVVSLLKEIGIIGTDLLHFVTWPEGSGWTRFQDLHPKPSSRALLER
jgi:hypothetical protein